MGVSDQPYAPAALPIGKEASERIEYKMVEHLSQYERFGEE
jgi:hypothetical protein